MKKIILASGSEGRKELFREVFGDNFETCSADLDESLFHDDNPAKLVELLAVKKAETVRGDYEDDFVFAFDTLVCCDGRVLGKPENLEKAEEMLNLLNNKTQVVWTGYAMAFRDVFEHGAVFAELKLSLTDEEIKDYVKNNPVTTYAGAYAVQKLECGEKIVAGSVDVIIGAPMNLVEDFVGAHFQDV